jgi:transcriptional regulator GlxA family with amidase domain
VRIGILLFDQVDLLDVGGPYEVFLTASRLVERDGGSPPFEVVTLGARPGPVTAYGGLRLTPQATLAD